MAEFCLGCWNRINGSKLTDKDLVISKGHDLCEGCGEIKHVILLYKKPKLRKAMLCKLRRIFNRALR